MEHQADKGHEVQARQDLGQALIVARQAAKAGGPSKVALDHPAARQEDKAVFGLGQLDDLQADTMCLGGIGSILAGVALI